MGIASQNLIEELYDNLMKIKERDMDLEELQTQESDKKKTHVSGLSAEQMEKLFLGQIRKGNKIVNSKEFKLVFYITCFVPFVRPNIPSIRETSLLKAKTL
jgi:hypothetical protein